MREGNADMYCCSDDYLAEEICLKLETLLKLLAAFLAFVLLTFLVGCNVIWFRNTVRNYNDFLSFSLGEFEVTNSEWQRRRNYWGFIPAGWIRYRVWEVEYRLYTGEVRSLSINNRPGGFSLDMAVIGQAGSIAEQQIIQDVPSGFFTDDERAPEGVVSIYFPSFQFETTPVVTDLQSGIRLRYITPQELVADWGVTFRLRATIRDHNMHHEITDRLKEMTRYLAVYLGQNRIFIEVTSRGDDADLSFRGHYCKQTDTFDVVINQEVIDARRAEQELEELQTRFRPANIDLSPLYGLTAEQAAQIELILSRFADYARAGDLDIAPYFSFLRESWGDEIWLRHYSYQWHDFSRGWYISSHNLNLNAFVYDREESASQRIYEWTERGNRLAWQHVEHENMQAALRQTLISSNRANTIVYLRIGNVLFSLYEGAPTQNYSLTNAFIRLLAELLEVYIT